MKHSLYLLGVGSSLPMRRLHNDDLAENLNTSHEWIVARTGIEWRHIAENERTTTLAVEAAKSALKSANVHCGEIGLIIVATSTADHAFPSVAAEVAQCLGVPSAMAFDVNFACSGFLGALAIARRLMCDLKSNRKALIIGAELMSRLLDWTDRSTDILFGDGAGAAVLGEEASGKHYAQLEGITSFFDAEGHDFLYAQRQYEKNICTSKIMMQGREVYKHAVHHMTHVVKNLMHEIKISHNQIDFFIPHQANKRIILSVAQMLDVKNDNIVFTANRHANTSAASIPLALDTIWQNGKRGQRFILTSFGGGFSAFGASFVFQ